MTSASVPATPMIGIIGVGAVGLAITERLVRGGLPVCGYRRSSMGAFREAGGLPMSSPEEVASADPLILLLPNDAALADVMQRITPSLREGQVVLCMGTHRVPAKQDAADLAARVGATLLDGEISGTPAMLRAGQASVLLAGDRKGMERALAVIDLFARKTTMLGDFGNATRMKLITNFMVGVHTAVAAEALHLGSRLGLTPRVVVDAIETSAAASVMMSVRGRMMADGDLSGTGLEMFVKVFDRLHETLPDLTPEQAPLLGVVEGLYRRAIEDGFGGRDIAAIYETLAARFGTALPEAAAITSSDLGLVTASQQGRPQDQTSDTPT